LFLTIYLIKIYKMKTLVILAFSTIFFQEFVKGDVGYFTSSRNEIPVVHSDSTYKVSVKKDIVYAKGLSHESINSVSSKEMSLKLDVYLPDNKLKNRPAIVLIHGGGFSGGTKEHRHIVNMAKYFASRGWVAFSIDYRLRKHKGTLPQEWVDNASDMAKERAPQFLSFYPAMRDAKAALRWIAANAESYYINTDYLTIGGGSAGAATAITIGISNQEDYRDELSNTQDPTLATTNLDQTYRVRTILDFWGGKTGLDILEVLYGKQRFNSNNPALLIAHGTEDPTVPFSKAEDLKSIYEENEVPYVFYPLEGKGHGVWGATFDNKHLDKLSFDFIVEQQNLIVK
jgi:acetyl esterase/lipase